MRPPLAIVLALSLCACGDERRTPAEYTTSLERTSTSSNDTALIPARATPPGSRDTLYTPAATAVRFVLAALGGSLVRGEVDLAASGERSTFHVGLVGGHPGTTYDGAVRLGSCRSPGATLTSLNPVTADSLGRGRAVTDVHIPADSVRKDPLVVTYGKGGRPEACGAIPGSTVPPRDSLRPPPSTASISQREGQR